MSEPTQESISDLLMEVGRGSRVAFRELYQRTRHDLFSRLVAILDEQQACEKVLEETYLRIWQLSHLYDSRRYDGMAWMNMITRTRAVSWLRQAPTGCEDDQHDRSGLRPQPVNRLIGQPHGDSPCTQRLPLESCEILRLAYSKGLSRTEIAQLTGIEEDHVRIMALEAMGLLKTAFSRSKVEHLGRHAL